MNFAQITLIGNVGRDPNVSSPSDGAADTRFSLAINKKEGKDGKEKPPGTRVQRFAPWPA